MVAGKPVVSPTLVGRREELAALVTVVTDVPAVVCVEGEAGVGKTRLVTELLRRAEVAHHEVLVGRCHQIRESFPLGPVVEAVRGAGDRLARLCLTPVAGALRPLLPELAVVLPAQPDPLDDPVGERHRVFRGLAEVLTALGRVVLVLEDLHWADEQTTDFVSYLLADPPPGLALVLVYRGEEASAAVRARTARVPAGTSRAHLVLAPLDERETGELAAAILGAEGVSEEFASYLHERTSGLPFVIEEVLALVRARGLVVQTSAGWTRRTLEHLEVPRGVRDSTLERVARLPTEAQHLAEAMAVLLTPAAQPVLLAMVDGIEADGATGALSDAIGSGLLVEEGETLAFRHMLAAQAVYENLTGPRRRMLHGRAAEALESLRPVPLGQVAHHAQQAGRLAEWAAKAEAAADQAAALGHDTEAARLLEDVLRHAPLEVAQRGRLAVKLGRAANNTLHAYGTVGLLTEVLEQHPPAAVRGELRLLLANALNQYGDDLSRQRLLFAQAVAELDERRDLQAWAMVALGLTIYPGVPVSESVGWLNRALALASDVGDPLLEVFVAGKAASILVQAGDPSWRGLADRIRGSTGDAPRQRREANAHYSLGVEACHAGHLRTAELLLTTGLQAPATQENRRLELMLRSALALLAFYSGRWDGLGGEAGDLLDPQSDLARSRVDVELVTGCLALAHGRVDDALQRLTGLIGVAERAGTSQLLAPAGDALARALLSRGEVEAAVATVRRCLAPLAAKDLWAPVARLLPTAAETLAAGDRAQAAELTGRFARTVQDRDAPLAPAALHYAQGVLAGSVADFHAAAELFEAARAPYEAARAREQAARLLIAARDERAASDLQRASLTYEQLGATWDYSRLAGLARSAGVGLAPHRRGRRGYGADLSPREREVAELAAKGRTNSEIARELFVSTSTVEKHMVAAKRKLRARSRTDLLRRLAGLELKMAGFRNS
jgi:DNA-binding CsgD family transcriptional regulator